MATDGRQERRDHAHRRRAWKALAITAVVGGLLLVAFDAWLRHVAEAGIDDPDHARWLIGWAGVMVNLVFAAVAALLAHYLSDWARQTRDQGQWPPAGLQLWGERPIRHGDDARRIASRLRSLAGLSWLLSAAVLAWTAWRLPG